VTGELLASMYLGEINMWNHPAIVTLNPTIAHKLPNETILLSSYLDNNLGLTRVRELLHTSMRVSEA